MIFHLALNLEVRLDFFWCCLLHQNKLVFEWCLSGLFVVFDLELLSWCSFFLLILLLLIFLLIFLVVFLLLFLWFWNLGFLHVVFLKETLLQHHNAVFIESQLEYYVEVSFLWILSRCLVVGNVTAEALDLWFVCHQHFYCLLFAKFDRFGCGKDTVLWEYQISLFFRIGLVIVGKWSSTWLNEVPMQLNWISIDFFKTILGNLEEWALHSSHQSTSSSNRLA